MTESAQVKRRKAISTAENIVAAKKNFNIISSSSIIFSVVTKAVSQAETLISNFVQSIVQASLTALSELEDNDFVFKLSSRKFKFEFFILISSDENTTKKQNKSSSISTSDEAVAMMSEAKYDENNIEN